MILRSPFQSLNASGYHWFIPFLNGGSFLMCSVGSKILIHCGDVLLESRGIEAGK